MDLALRIIGWLLAGIALAPVMFGLCWPLWWVFVAPRLMARSTIRQCVERAVREARDDPQAFAFAQEREAWYRSDLRELGCWRRVRLLFGWRRPSMPAPSPRC